MSAAGKRHMGRVAGLGCILCRHLGAVARHGQTTAAQLRHERRAIATSSDFIEVTGYTRGQVRAGLVELEKDEQVRCYRQVIAPHTSIKFWELK